MGDLCAMDLVPEPPIVAAALRACRRVNDYSLTTRYALCAKGFIDIGPLKKGTQKVAKLDFLGSLFQCVWDVLNLSCIHLYSSRSSDTMTFIFFQNPGNYQGEVRKQAI